MLTPDPSGLTALIIAHDDLVAALLGIMLELEGYLPLFARPGESSLAELARTRPNLALVDYEFARPQMSEMAEWVRGTRTSLVIFSPSRDHRDVKLLAEAYGLAWFAPPFVLTDLARAIGDARRRA